MTSRRRLRRNACGQKRRYPDQTAAKRAIWLGREMWRGYVNAYLCKFCGHWHIGHPPSSHPPRR